MPCTAPGAGGPSPSHGLLCGVSELERRALAPNILSFYMQVVLTHHSHSGPCTHLFNLDILEIPGGGGKGLESPPWSVESASHQGLLMAVVKSWDDGEG